MASIKPDSDVEDILRELMAQATTLWGAERVTIIRSSLEQMARHLHNVGQSLPDPGVEPGFYQ
ncbi:MAG: hypothetical protein V3U27_18410 [Candidatus Tectomicrobia bacterium]